MNVYFVSGLATNCKVFDRLELPASYNKFYIEWYIPNGNETIEEYALKMTEVIDQSKPFVLIGYSLGGIIIQEMNKFITPVKNIIISSIKSVEETPPLFRWGRKIDFAERFPIHILEQYEYVIEIFARMIYQANPEETKYYLSYTDPVYMKWAINEIINWEPTIVCDNLYHIHGTEDHIFPYKYIKDAIRVERGNHMMVIKKYKAISNILKGIL